MRLLAVCGLGETKGCRGARSPIDGHDRCLASDGRLGGFWGAWLAIETLPMRALPCSRYTLRQTAPTAGYGLMFWF